MSVVLIGGTSHVGKSTLGADLAAALGWSLTATDSLARHPGRPWAQVRPHVVEFYENLSAPTIYRLLLDHHRNLWPGIRELISRRTDPLIIEGSALRPELVAELPDDNLDVVWLTASDAFIIDRIHVSSGFSEASPQSQYLIQCFIDRSLTDNARIVTAAAERGLMLIDVEDPSSLATFHTDCLARHAG